MSKNKDSSFGGDAVKLTSSKVITLIIALVTSMLLSRFRTLEEYGTYSQLLLVTNLCSSLFMIGLPNSINYFLSRADTKAAKEKFLSAYYTLSTILSIIEGIILVLSIPIIVWYFKNDMITSFVYFFALYPWARIISSSIDHVLVVQKKTTLLMIYKLINNLILLLIVLIVQILRMTFRDYILLFIIVECIFAFSVYILVNKRIGKIRVLLEKTYLLDILKFSIPIGIASVVGTLNYNLDQLMIAKFFNTDQLALYANAGKEMPVTLIATSLTAVLLPRLVPLLVKQENQKAVYLWGNTVELSYIFICLFSAGFITFAPDVMSLLYSEKYLPGVDIFRVYNLVLLLRCTYFGIILNSLGKTKFIMYSSIASLGINCLLNYLFYLIFGFNGPAIATLIATSVMQFAQLWATSRSINVKMLHLFPWWDLCKITLVNIIFAVISYIGKMLIPLDMFIGNIAESILIGVIWVTIYGIVLFPRLKTLWKSINGGVL